MRVSRRIAGPTVAALAIGWALAGCASTPAPVTSGTGAVRTTAAERHLDVAGFAGLLSAPGTVLIDVRTAQEYAAGHLPGARNLDLLGGNLAAALPTLDRSASYALYCHSGNRSGQALRLMAAQGFTHVADLSGGIAAWQAAGRPLSTN